MPITKKERVEEIINYALEFGDEKTSKDFNISISTINRYRSQFKNKLGKKEVFENKDLLKKISARYSDKELQFIANGGINQSTINKEITDFKGEKIKFGFMTDTHIGSKYFHEIWLKSAFDEFKKQKVEFICHTGDVTEGMTSREGHVYDLTHIGYDAQKEYAISLFKNINVPIYAVDGNHDRWTAKSSGALIVKDISKELKNFKFIGHDEGDIIINGCTIKLWHGEDGSSYATSYRPQKIVESFTGGEKPNVLLCGHTHKHIYMFERNIHCVSGGALCSQSSWMRRKKLANHSGFWIIEMVVGNGHVKTFTPTWYPFYA